MKRVIMLIAGSFLLGCNMTSDKTQKQFKAVNDSLVQSNATGNDNRAAYEMEPGHETLQYIDSLKQLLAADSEAGTRITEQVMINDGEGERLYTKLQQTYAACRTAATDKAAVDNVFSWLRDNKNAAVWAAQNFKDVPAFAAITLLNKYAIDCRNAMQLAAAK